MDTKTFLQRVVAATDNLVISVHRPDPTGVNKKGFFWNYANCITLDDAVAKIQEVDRQTDLTAYFAVGTHSNNTEPKANGGTKILRKKSTSTWFKALALDLDIGHDKGSPYNSQKEGLQALIAAIKTFSFPDPMVVSSGRGIHCYWPLHNEIPTNEWEKLSIALRLALRDGGVVIDESKIHDASMVLRPAGSHHKKGTPWVEVKVVADCPNYDVTSLGEKLAPWFGKALPRSPKPRSASSSPSSPQKMSSVAAAILRSGYEPLNLSAVAGKCAQLAALIASRGATDATGKPVSEPLWRASMGVAAYSTDPHQAMLDLCSGHPDFDLQENESKLAGWKGTGVTTCDHFDRVCPGVCNGCAEHSNINSPAALNRLDAYHITNVANDPTASADSADEDEIEVLPLPPGYFAAQGKVWTEVEVEKVITDGEGKKQKITVTERVLVSRYPIVVLDRYAAADYERTTILWATQFPVTGWMAFEMPADVMMQGGAELAKYFGNKQLFVAEEALINRMRKYMVSYVEHIQRERPTGMDRQSFGWQKDGTFLAGDKLIQKGSHHASWRAVKSLQKMSKRIGTRGDRETWAATTSLLDEPCARHIGFSMMLAGSGLLLPATGLQSFVYSLWSPETGTGKTLALLFGNSLFGHPSENLLTPRDTSNSIYQIMGTLGSYSAAMDEITNMGPERAAEFAFDAQTGREKTSLTQGRELREGTEWHAPLRVTTNTSLYYMYDLYKSKNDAEKVRTLEVQVDSKEFVQKHDIEALVAELSHNYGFAAPEIAEEIMNSGGIHKVYERAKAGFDATFNFKFESDERFYRAGIITSWAVGKIGQKLNLFRFDVNACTEWILQRVVQLRNIRSNGRLDVFDIVGQFLSDHNDQLIISKEDVGSKPVIQMPIPDVAVARIELVYDKNVLQPGSKVMISTAKMKEWAKRTREDTNNLIIGLKTQNAVLNDKERVTLYKGTHSSNPGQTNCVVLNLLHPRFAAVIGSNKAIVPTSPSLAVLQGGKP